MNRILFFLPLILISMFSSCVQQKQMLTLSWKRELSLPAFKGQSKDSGVAGAVIGVIDDLLIVAGGSDFPSAKPWVGGTKKYYQEGIVLKKNIQGAFEKWTSFLLPYPVAYAATTAIPGGIVVAGGENETGILEKVMLIRCNRDKKELLFEQMPPLPGPLVNASAVSVQNAVYVAGGEDAAVTSDKFISLDLNNVQAGWRSMPSLPQAVSHAFMAVMGSVDNHVIFLVGGRKKNSGGISEIYSNTYAFNLLNGAWQAKHPLPLPLAAGTGVNINDHRMLLFGGDDGTTFLRVEALIAAINKEVDTAKKKLFISKKAEMQSTHPGFTRDVLFYDTDTDDWKPAGRIPWPAPVTTTAVKLGNEIIIPTGEIKAGVRTAQIISAKIPR